MTSSSGSSVGPALARWAGARLLPESNVPCAAPFVTLEFGAYGMVQACCANALYPVGDVRHQTIQEIWDGFRINELRDAFRAGDLGPGCGVCRFRLLHTPGELPRNFYDNFGFAGGDTPEWPTVLSFSLHNTCNLACVMCGGDESSKIRSVRDQLPPLPHVYGDEFFEQLRPFLDHCDYADFVGGEPFLVREHERVWDLLVEGGRPVRCSVATNGTVWNDRVEHVLGELDFQVTVSVDGITRETFEKIRVGASYDEVFRNIERFRAYTAERDRPFTICWSLVRDNWAELPDMLRWCEERSIPLKIQTVMDLEWGVQRAPDDELRHVVETYRAADDRLGRELQLNLDVWRRELRRLEDELASRGVPADGLRQMRGPEFDNAGHVQATVLDGPTGGPAPAADRAAELIAPWAEAGGGPVQLVLAPDGTVDGAALVELVESAGRVTVPAPTGATFADLLRALSAPFGGGVWLSEEFVEPDVVEHVLFLARLFRDKTGLIVRTVSWHEADGSVQLAAVVSTVLLDGGSGAGAAAGAVPVQLGPRPS
ncbi:MAG: radical SAM protein [Actinomycetes bacterium]